MLQFRKLARLESAIPSHYYTIEISLMKTNFCCCILFSLATLFATSSSARAITIGQVDDFQDGTTQGWKVGNPHPVPPINSTDNGPAGIGDHALLLATNGLPSGAGSRLAADNPLQWTGDYLAAGVKIISLDANNLSGRPVTLRLAADGDGGRFSTTTSFLLPAASGWQSLLFPVEPADWAAAGGVLINDTLANLTKLRLLDNVAPSFRGTAGAAELLVDNITALVPEPSTFALCMLTSITLLTRRRRTPQKV